MNRTLQPELLDALSPDHPAALHNRRDLRIINRVTGNHRWLERALAARALPAERLLEIGAGDGGFLARLATRNLRADGLDLWPRPAALPAAQAWHRADLRRFDRFADYPVVFGNLIFHQFGDPDLAVLGNTLRSTARVIVACEPARRRVSQALFAAIAPLLWANYVTLHDAHVSIAAGFRRDELPVALGLDPAAWSWQCTVSWLGSYRMVATRRA
jgi:hypothetical protein